MILSSEHVHKLVLQLIEFPRSRLDWPASHSEPNAKPEAIAELDTLRGNVEVRFDVTQLR
jgi:hypothetical protein